MRGPLFRVLSDGDEDDGETEDATADATDRTFRIANLAELVQDLRRRDAS